MRKKQWSCFLLALVFCLGLIPAAAIPTRAAEEISNWASLNRRLSLSGEYILTRDVGFRTGGTFETRDVVVPAGKEVVLDLCGHTIDRTDPEGVSRGSVITVYGKLTVTDSSSGGSGAITGGYADCGAGINVQPGGELILNGGSINDNAASREGGGVFLGEGSSLTVSGGSIRGNSAAECGGGVYADADSSLAMSGGSIENNTSPDGGGIFLCNAGFTMSRGNITGNTGGGVREEGGSITLAEIPNITGNTDLDGGPLNLCLNEGTLVDASELGGRANIGVTAPWAVSPRAFTSSLYSSRSAYSFQSDDPIYVAECSDAGQATLEGALVIGGVGVTRHNCADVLGDGKVSYDPASDTLSLGGVTVTAPDGISESCGIWYRGSSELRIAVTGANTVAAGAAPSGSCGIFNETNRDMIFSGTGTLTALGGKSDTSTGIFGYGLIFEGGVTVNAVGDEAVSTSEGVYASAVTVREDASLNAAGGQAESVSYGIETWELHLEDRASVTACTLSDDEYALPFVMIPEFPDGAQILGSSRPDGSDAVPYDPDSADAYKWIRAALIPAPGAIGSVTAAASPGKITVSWTAAENAEAYIVQRRVKDSPSWTTLKSNVTGLSNVDTAGEDGVVYQYRVRGRNGDRYGPFKVSSVVRFTAAVIPGAIAEATAAAAPGRIVLQWTAAENATAYIVQRREKDSLSWTTLASNVSGLSYEDTTGTAGTVYQYRVRGRNGSDYGPFKATSVVRFAAGAAVPEAIASVTAVASPGKITVGWTAAENATAYIVQRRVKGSDTWTTLKSNVTGLRYVDSACVAGTVYQYRVRGRNGTAYGPFRVSSVVRAQA